MQEQSYKHSDAAKPYGLPRPEVGNDRHVLAELLVPRVVEELAGVVLAVVVVAADAWRVRSRSDST